MRRDGSGTYREALRYAAGENHGYLTPELAEHYGVPKVELRKLASRGAFVKIARGVYRDPFFPAGEHDQLRELLLMVGEGAYLAGDSVLALLELADVNPQKVTIASPRRHQREFPAVLDVIKAQPGDEPRLYHGLPCQSVAQAIRLSAPGLMRERVEEAIFDARENGYLLRREHNALLEEFAHV